MAAEAAEAEVEVEAVGNYGKQVVTAVNRQQHQQMDGDGGDLLEWMTSGEVSAVL
jgi:hypothetical protein